MVLVMIIYGWSDEPRWSQHLMAPMFSPKIAARKKWRSCVRGLLRTPPTAEDPGADPHALPLGPFTFFSPQEPDRMESRRQSEFWALDYAVLSPV